MPIAAPEKQVERPSATASAASSPLPTCATMPPALANQRDRTKAIARILSDRVARWQAWSKAPIASRGCSNAKSGTGLWCRSGRLPAGRSGESRRFRRDGLQCHHDWVWLVVLSRTGRSVNAHTNQTTCQYVAGEARGTVTQWLQRWSEQ